MDNLFTWSMLGTLAGASAIAYLIVAYTKDLFIKSKLAFLGVDLYAVFVSFIVLLSAWITQLTVFTWQAILSMIGLALFNAFLVAATAAKMHDKAISTQKKEGE
jgi:hypothetical protein